MTCSCGYENDEPLESEIGMAVLLGGVCGVLLGLWLWNFFAGMFAFALVYTANYLVWVINGALHCAARRRP